ncbi:MAG: glucose-6-phosphate isomerase family protein [Spirochaetia bacterium]|jgi:glucose-6-phosphate isomerase
MVMKLSGGESAYERFLHGRMVYVLPLWGHRTVNTGDEPLICFCVYPGEARHNYGEIDKEGLSVRVLKRAGKVEILSSGPAKDGRG